MSITGICKREWQWLLRDKKYVAMVMLAPILFVLTLGGIYFDKKVTSIPVAIVDQDHSALSRELTRAVMANETFQLAGYLNSADEFSAFAAQDRAKVCFVFQRGLEKDVKGRMKARVEVLVDNSNYLVGSVAISNFSRVLATYSTGVEIRMTEALHGIPSSEAVHPAIPVSVGERMLFNPAFNSNYLNFMVAAFSFVPVQLGGLLVAIRSGSSEYGQRDFQKPLDAMPGAIVAGKLLAHITVILPVLAVTLLIPHWLFGVPFFAGSYSFWIVLLWFTAIMVTLGFGLSSVTGDTLFSTELCAILTLPNFLLAGVTWPVFAMPKFMWPLAYGFPMNSFAFMIKKITVMGGSLADCGNQLGGMIGWSIAAVSASWMGARKIRKAAVSRGKNHA